MGDTESSRHDQHKNRQETTPETGVVKTRDCAGASQAESTADTTHDSGVDITGHDSGEDGGHGDDSEGILHSQRPSSEAPESVVQTPDSGVDTHDFATDVSESVDALDDFEATGLNEAGSTALENEDSTEESTAGILNEDATVKTMEKVEKSVAAIADIKSPVTTEVDKSPDGHNSASVIPTGSNNAATKNGSNTAGVNTDVTTSPKQKSATGRVEKDGAQSTDTTRKMEEELAFLREEVRSKATTVQRLQTSLFEQQVRSNAATMALRTQLRKKDLEAGRARAQHEQQMSTLLAHLLYLEGQMKQEQREIVLALHDKEDVIRRQRAAIEDLASKNSRLLVALKEAHGYSGGNGISPFPSPVVGGEKGGNGVVTMNGQQVLLRNKDKSNSSHKVRFGLVKDKLRRHKSSLELYRPETLETLMEGTLRYGSQENLSDGTTPGVGGGGGSSPGMCSDELKRSRLQDRKERCRSMVDYPFRLNDLPEVSAEVERGKLTPEPQVSPDQRSLAASPNHLSLTPTSRDLNPHSDEEEAVFLNGRMYGELAKSASVPHALSGTFEHDVTATPRERPHSLGGVELTSLNNESVSPTNKVSMTPSPTSTVPPGGSESNPFKSFKNVFRRRNSKQRSKKRPVSLGPGTNEEYHDALNAHFKKYDLS